MGWRLTKLADPAGLSVGLGKSRREPLLGFLGRLTLRGQGDDGKVVRCGMLKATRGLSCYPDPFFGYRCLVKSTSSALNIHLGEGMLTPMWYKGA